MTGTVKSVHVSEDYFGGSFGEIEGDGKRHYVWSSPNVFRNGTHMEIGLRVTFRSLAYSYATDISETSRLKSDV